MNPVLLFLFLVALLTVVVLWWVVRPLLRAATPATSSTAPVAAQTNVEALRVELSEARRDHALGLLSAPALAEAERELEARVLSESQGAAAVTAPRYKRTAIALALTLPVLAIVGYAAVGTPIALVPEAAQPAAAAKGAAPGTPNLADQQMDELFRLAEERLKAQPDDVKGWTLLARAKASVGMFDGAMAAYEKAVALDAKDSDLWSDYADAAAGQAQGTMSGKPIELVNKALALDGRNAKALLLRGTWEIQTGKLAEAEKSFTLARSLVDANSGFAQIADNALADVKNRRTGGSATAPAAGNTARGDTGAVPETAAASDAVLATVKLTLGSEALQAAKASTNAAVFVIVRAAGADRGPPLAAKKVALADLDKPLMFTAADAMIGGAGLKAGAEVMLQARLSLNGQPTAQSGDWQSSRATVKLPAPAATLSIDQRI